jgi:LmbE family N-acetylglucosaminyl deacetylase
MSELRLPMKTLVATLVCAAVLLALVTRAAAAEPSCAGTTGSSMYMVAHEDDDLIFQSPNLSQEIASDRCVRTVFLTAGDDGQPRSYWSAREEGVEAAYSQMAEVADAWSESIVEADGHSILLKTLTADPRISVVFMRLPDGIYPEGKGSPRYGNQSLMQLWNNGNPCSGCAKESSIRAVDGSNEYDYQELIETLASLINAFEPRQIATQNYTEEFFHGDHPDHVATAYFVREAQKLYTRPHRLRGYVGYNTEFMAPNVTGGALASKSSAFYVYGAHDSEVCDSVQACEGGEYATWLQRQYIAAAETTGVVADAGVAQTVTASQAVTLDGSQSSDQSSHPLGYEWVQTRGPTVALSNPFGAEPTLTMPSHPTLLTFSLMVRDELTRSEPDFVNIRVPGETPTPLAIAGADQVAGSGATVDLDGSGSWDPNSEPLSYAWRQTGGPEVAISGAATPTPSFIAPTGPAAVTLSLVVSNGTEESEPSEVTTEVKGIAPTVTSPNSTAFTMLGSQSFTVTTTGSPAAAISETGNLPSGLSFVDNGDGTAALSGTLAAGSAPARGSSTYMLTLAAENELGLASQQFTLTVIGAEATLLPPPTGIVPDLSAPTTSFAIAGRGIRIPVGASGSPAPTLSLASELPVGLRFASTGLGTGVIYGKPTGAGTDTLTLTAKNAHGTAVQTIILVVEPQPHLSRRKVVLPDRADSRQLVRVSAGPGSRVRCSGRLPQGARCRTRADGNLVLEGTRSARRPGRYRLEVRVSGRAGTVIRHLLVQVCCPT